MWNRRISRVGWRSAPVLLGRLTSLAWGGFAVASGMVFERSGSGVLELVNLVGSAFYGPVLAVFVVGILVPGVRGRDAVTGLLTGLVANLSLAELAPGVSWLWWNPAGFLVSILTAVAICRAPLALTRLEWPRRPAVILVGAFVVMLSILTGLPSLLAAIMS